MEEEGEESDGGLREVGDKGEFDGRGRGYFFSQRFKNPRKFRWEN